MPLSLILALSCVGVPLPAPLPPPSAAADLKCGPAPSFDDVEIRGHVYEHLGGCAGVQVWRTAWTDSNLDDMAAVLTGLVPLLQAPVVLASVQPQDPHTEEEEGWPTPAGNLYFAYLDSGPPETAMERTQAAVERLYLTHFPSLELLPASDPTGSYGGHRVGELFVSGITVQPLDQRTGVGLDVHLMATRQDYDRYTSGAEHTTPAIMGLPALAPEQALWELLGLLEL